MTAQQLVGVVAAEYYREGGSRKREGLRPLMEVIERAHPGVVELSGTAEKPGYAVRLAERPFPKRYEAELRQAIQAVGVDGYPQAAAPRRGGFFARFLDVLRRVFRT